MPIKFAEIRKIEYAGKSDGITDAVGDGVKAAVKLDLDLDAGLKNMTDLDGKLTKGTDGYDKALADINATRKPDTDLNDLTKSSISDAAAAKSVQDAAKKAAKVDVNRFRELIGELESGRSVLTGLDPAKKTEFNQVTSRLKTFLGDTDIENSAKKPVLNLLADLKVGKPPVAVDASNIEDVLKSLGLTDNFAQSYARGATKFFKNNAALLAKIGVPTAAVLAILFVIFDTEDAAKIVSALADKAMQVTGADDLVDWFKNTFGEMGGKIVGAISGVVVGGILIYIVFLLVKSLSSSSSSSSS